MTVRSMRAAAARNEGPTLLVGQRRILSGETERSALAMSPAAIALARVLYHARRKRGRFLAADLFGEPTWDMLLDLYVALGEGRRVPTTSACIGADVPPTTALRWLRILETRGLVEREDDGRDGRRTFVQLTARGSRVMTELLESWVRAIQPALGQPALGQPALGQVAGAPMGGERRN